MTALGLAIAAVLRSALDALVATIVAHLRAWRPVVVGPLGVLPPPGESIRDPRSKRAAS